MDLGKANTIWNIHTIYYSKCLSTLQVFQILNSNNHLFWHISCKYEQKINLDFWEFEYKVDDVFLSIYTSCTSHSINLIQYQNWESIRYYRMRIVNFNNSIGITGKHALYIITWHFLYYDDSYRLEQTPFVSTRFINRLVFDARETTHSLLLLTTT